MLGPTPAEEDHVTRRRAPGAGFLSGLEDSFILFDGDKTTIHVEATD